MRARIICIHLFRETILCRRRNENENVRREADEKAARCKFKLKERLVGVHCSVQEIKLKWNLFLLCFKKQRRRRRIKISDRVQRAERPR